MQVDRSGNSNLIMQGSLITIPDELISDKTSDKVAQLIDSFLYSRFREIVTISNATPDEVVFTNEVFRRYFTQLKTDQKIDFDKTITRIVVKDPNAILKMVQEIFSTIKSRGYLNIAEIIFSRSNLNDDVIKKKISNNMSDWNIICFYGITENKAPLANYDKQTKSFIRFSNLPL